MNGLISHFNRGSRCVHLGHGSEFGIHAALVKIPGGLVSDQPGKFNFGGHVGQFMLGHLELSNFASELLAFFHIGKGAVISALGGSQCLGRNQNSTLIKKLQNLIKALAFFSDKIGGRNPHVFKIHFSRRHHMNAHLFPKVGGGNAFPFSFHQNQADASIRRLTFSIGLAHYRVKTGQAPIGDKCFGTVDDPLISIAHRNRIQRRNI